MVALGAYRIAFYFGWLVPKSPRSRLLAARTKADLGISVAVISGGLFLIAHLAARASR